MSEEFKLMLLATVKRYLRAFAAGAVGQLLLMLTATSPQQILTDPKAWLTAALFGSLTGGLMALDKVLRWKD